MKFAKLMLLSLLAFAAPTFAQQLVFDPLIQAIDVNGNPISGAKLYIDDAGTSTDRTTYSDSALTTPNANPLVADASGRFGPIFLASSDTDLKLTLDTSADVNVWTQDNVPASFVTAAAVGLALHPQTTEESAAAVTPSAYQYKPCDVRRYGATGDGTTDDRAAFVTADSIGTQICVLGGLDYAVASNVTITNPVWVEASSTLKPGSGAAITLSSPISAPHQEILFTGDGTVVLSEPQAVWVDWWDRTATTSIQEAIDATAQGSQILLAGKYTTSGIELNSDEANQTGDIGKALVGIAAPGLRLNDKTTGSWGAEIYLADSSDDDVIDINGTDQGSNNGSRFSLVLRNLKINGNKANQSAGAWNGIRIDHAKDIWLENVYIEDCKQDGINASSGGSNQVHFSYVEIYNCDRDGMNLGSLADFSGGTVKTATNARYGIAWAAGHGHFDHIHTYLNTDDGFRYTVTANDARGSVNTLRSSFNGHTGVWYAGNNLHVSRLEMEHNGTDTGEGNVNRVGLHMTSAATAGVFESIEGWDGEGTPTQTYHVYVLATNPGNKIDDLLMDANATVGDLHVAAAARNMISVGVASKQTSATTTGNQELNPQLGDLVMTGTLTGALDFDYTTATKVPNGHRQKVILQDGGGQNITFGTNATAIATAPTPATNAKHNIMEIEYYDGEAFLVRASQEP